MPSKKTFIPDVSTTALPLPSLHEPSVVLPSGLRAALGKVPTGTLPEADRSRAALAREAKSSALQHPGKSPTGRPAAMGPRSGHK